MRNAAESEETINTLSDQQIVLEEELKGLRGTNQALLEQKEELNRKVRLIDSVSMVIGCFFAHSRLLFFMNHSFRM